MNNNSDNKDRKGKAGDLAALLLKKIRNIGTWYKNLFRGRPWYIKIVSGVCSIFILFILYLIAVDNNFLWLFGKSPTIEDIKTAETSEASELYSADGVLIGKYFSENRTPVAYEDVNPVFWQALISTEDERFYSHFGVDLKGIVAAGKDYIVHRDARGASTITQQLVKNMLKARTDYPVGPLGKVPGLKLLIMKTKEWITAVKIELYFDKKEILTMYANTVDFGSNAFGIKTACKTYFGNTPKEMTTEQAAVLVGMLKATTFYNPKINPKNSLRRRNTVLNNMMTHGFITKAQYDTMKSVPIKLDYSVENNYDGQALYFREAVAGELREWLKENGKDLYRDGLKIYTTIDTRMQKYAEEAARKQMKVVQRNFDNHWGKTNPWQDEHHVEIPDFIENLAKKLPVYKYLTQKYPDSPDSVDFYLTKTHTVKLFDYENGTVEKEMSTMDSIRYMERFMHCGFVAMESETGHVKAWVGDIDCETWKYDKVTAMRQPGSTFKLFVYAEAMNQGLTPCDRRVDSYFSMKVYDSRKKKEVIWAPTNANGYFTGDSMPLKAAFAQSINSVAVKLGQEVGIENIITTAKAMGIKSKLDATPSLTLGASDVNLLELVNSYATAANDGKMHEPVLVTRIVDRNGNEIYKAPTEQRQALSAKSAFLVQKLLMGGMREPGGTSMNLWRYVGKYNDTEFGGKTGTSNNHSDAWFVGVSPKLVAGAWVGGEYRSIHFRTGQLGQGSRTALPICGYFFESVLGDPDFKKYHGKFSGPGADVDYGMYTCASYYQRRDSDSIASDSIATPDMETIKNDGGEPYATDNNNATPPPAHSDRHQGEATENKKTAVDDVYF